MGKWNIMQGKFVIHFRRNFLTKQSASLYAACVEAVIKLAAIGHSAVGYEGALLVACWDLIGV